MRSEERATQTIPNNSYEGRKIEVLTPTEQLMHSTVMIRSKDAKGNQSAGTGFIFNLFNHNGQGVPVLVTNKHVVSGSTEGSLVFTEANAEGLPKYGSNISFSVTDFSKAWTEHPDRRLISLFSCLRRS